MLVCRRTQTREQHYCFSVLNLIIGRESSVKQYFKNCLCVVEKVKYKFLLFSMHLSSIQLTCAALVAVALGAAAPPSTSHHVARRSFFTLECKGVYDAAIFARLDRICDDCFNLFREPQLYALCRNECFTSDYFKGCVEVLQETDHLELFKEYIRIIHGADPGI